MAVRSVGPVSTSMWRLSLAMYMSSISMNALEKRCMKRGLECERRMMSKMSSIYCETDFLRSENRAMATRILSSGL